jgi:ribonuclease VapC
MVVDTSALVAIFRREPDWARFLNLMTGAAPLRMSAASWVELSLVAMGQLRPSALADIDTLRQRLGLELVAFDAAQAATAREALERFGRGRHPARLNLGDSFAYALAKHLDEPLLFKGDDFAKTDITPALTR